MVLFRENCVQGALCDADTTDSVYSDAPCKHEFVATSTDIPFKTEKTTYTYVSHSHVFRTRHFGENCTQDIIQPFSLGAGKSR